MDGHYCGHNDIIDSLRKDVFRTMIAGRPQTVSRWAMNLISDDLRNEANATEAELKAQFDKVHGGATIRSADKSIVPSQDLLRDDGTSRPIVAVRIFHGGPQQVINNIAYYFHYGFMMCNLAQDVHLEEGVYGYVDIESALSKLDLQNPAHRTKCIGLIEGYLRYRHEDKVSLNPRSTKLIAVFHPGIQKFTYFLPWVQKIHWHYGCHPTSWEHPPDGLDSYRTSMAARCLRRL